tara:strand:+ start:760 stop:1425 length:666 start_codon:yes stop_codon:yes gene_type:complete
MSIAKALLALAPGAQWSIKDDKIHWSDTEQTEPTREEIVQKIAEIEYTEEVESYKEVRAKAYPVMSEQLDKIFHDGVDAWKADIQAIKDAHPKAVIDNDTLNSRKSQALFDLQLQEYTKAQARLTQYQVALGREEVVENQPTGEQILNEDTQQMDDVMADVITVTAIDALDATVEQTTYDENVATTATVENPLITKDNAERAEAQAIVDATPQSVIDTYNE